ncbi:hypothetical protein [Clostridium cochlearium]|uniref:hypothetical protein n=1 Tax=Clostridium cochlearium TaxID=1494 RepID=UPI0017D4CA98|nr:hypothetical protein [Clostridium cochlearium]NMA58588.1 hypothetical protein [Clostridium cochlearium]
MKLKELQEILDKILDLRMERFYDIEELDKIYRDLILLKEEIIKFSLIGLLPEEIEIFDYIKFRALEELYLVELDIKEKNGLDTKNIKGKLESLYAANGGDL